MYFLYLCSLLTDSMIGVLTFEFLSLSEGLGLSLGPLSTPTEHVMCFDDHSYFPGRRNICAFYVLFTIEYSSVFLYVLLYNLLTIFEEKIQKLFCQKFRGRPITFNHFYQTDTDSFPIPIQFSSKYQL